MNLSKKTESIIKIICILVLISLNLAIIINGKDLSCNKCQVSIQKDNQIFKVNITEIYESYLNNECIDYGIKSNF